MSNIIKFPRKIGYIEAKLIYEDDNFAIGFGYPDDEPNEPMIIVRSKPDGISWHWRLNESYERALDNLEGQ